jgi:hypothetical protein
VTERRDKTQADKFRELARDLECDEDAAAFEEKVRKVAGSPRVRPPSTDAGVEEPNGNT